MGGPIKQIVLCHSESIENLCERCEHINFLLFRISTKQKGHGHPELVSATVPNKSCNQYIHIVKLRNKIVLNSKNGLPQSCKCTPSQWRYVFSISSLRAIAKQSSFLLDKFYLGQ